MKFKCTDHARKRILERGLKFPNSTLILNKCNKKDRKNIRLNTVNSGCDTKKYVYFKYLNNGFKTICVCVQIEIDVFCVITAFNLNENIHKKT